MTKLGMDAGTIRSLADQMDRLAAHLESIIGSVEGSVHQAGSMWFGSDSAAFRDDWARGHRPALTVLAHDIRSLAGTARTNAAEQDSASGATGGSGSSGAAARGIVGGAQRLWRDGLKDFSDRLDRLNTIPGLPGLFDHWHRVLHAAPFLHGTAGRLDKDFAHLGRQLDHLSHGAVHSPGVQQLLHSSPVHGAGEVIAGSADTLGKIGSGVDVVTDGVNAFHHAHQGDVSGELHDLSHATSTMLKSSKNPEAYLGGVIVSEYTDVIDQAAKIDWHQGLPAPTPSNLYHDYAPAVWDSVTAMPSHVWKWIW